MVGADIDLPLVTKIGLGDFHPYFGQLETFHIALKLTRPDKKDGEIAPTIYDMTVGTV